MTRKVLHYFDILIEGGAVTAFIGMCLAILIQVAARYVHYPTPWAEELSRFLNVWTVFLASAYAVKQGTHLSIRVLLDRLPRPWHLAVTLVIDTLVLGLLMMVCWGSMVMMKSSYTMISSGLQLRMTYFYLGVCVGSAAMGVYYALQIAATVRALVSPSLKGQ